MPEKDVEVSLLTHNQVVWDGARYVIVLGEGVEKFIPFQKSGKIWFNDVLQDQPFRISQGDKVEFHPLVQVGRLTWDIEIRFQGLSVEAKVRHELPGRYILDETIPVMKEIDLAQYVTWQDLPAQGEFWDEGRLNAELEHLKIVHGRKPNLWQEIQAIEGVGEVVVAEATLPVPPEDAQLIDFVGKPEEFSNTEESRIDFFASKVKLVQAGAILARKIPGRSGVPGKDVLGKTLGVAPFKDFVFLLKKNVYLSEDGLEVISACDGQPIRLDTRTYKVENVYVLHKDVDIATGSIEFPGDVFINGNVHDGLRVFAGGKIEIRGSVSHAELKAEKGAKIHQNLLGGKIVVGEKFVVRSELLRRVTELQDQLSVCLRNTAELIKSPGANNLKPGQCLKIILEKQFPELPRVSTKIESFVLEHKGDEIITEGFIVSIRTAKHFLTGLGPLDPQSLPFLLRVNQALAQFIGNIAVEVPEKLTLVATYVQGTVIECGGAFECQKGTYNSDIRVVGDVTIQGVCRGGKIFAGGKVSIRELGSSEVSSTFVQISSKSRLNVDYCHPNVIVAVGKKIIHIEEAYRKLVIYEEQGRLQMEKIRANPL